MSDPKPLPLVAPIGARYDSLIVDSRIINGYVEKGQDGALHVYKRPGFNSIYDGPAGVGRGIHTWRNSIYYVKEDKLYKDNVALAGNVENSGFYSFTSTQGTPPSLFLTNGTSAFAVVDGSGTVTDVTGTMHTSGGGPMTEKWVADCTYLRGYLIVFSLDSTLHTSAPNDTSSWPALQYIGVDLEPDEPVALHKQLFSVLAIKEFYTEVFYITENEAILSPIPGGKINFGCVDGRTLSECGGDVAWVGRTREGSVAVIFVSDLRAQVISTPPIERILQNADYSQDVFSWSIKVDGHRFYGLGIQASNICLVYDFTSGFWSQWTDADGDYLPFAGSTIGLDNSVLFQHANNGNLYNFKGSFSGDTLIPFGDIVPFCMDIYTPNFDGGTRRTKTLTKLAVMADRRDNATLDMWYSDDDYQTWKYGGQVDLGSDDPFWADLGSFKRRAFRFSQTVNAPLRIQAIEAYLDVGSA
jgi:hypothetical protein